MNPIVARLAQPSTWRGLALAALAFGVSQEAVDSAATIGIGVIAAWEILRNGRTFKQAGLQG